MVANDTVDTKARLPLGAEYLRLGLWRIQRQSDPAQTRYLETIHRFLIPLFCRIFRTKEKQLEPCDVFCDPTAATPMLILNRTPIAIRLNVRSTAYWCQVLYQWSHELAHFFTRQQKPHSDRTRMIAWFEETFCEAISNLTLEYAADHWSECDLSSLNLDYATAIREYLANLFNESSPHSVLRCCVTLEELADLEKTCTENRPLRSVERDLLYQHLRRRPSSAATIACYARYVQRPTSSQERLLGPLLVDFDRWESVATPDQLETLYLLRRIQPNIRQANPHEPEYALPPEYTLNQ